MTIDDNAFQNSDVIKNGIKCIIANEICDEICDSPSSALQIIILIIEITIGMI